MRHLTKTLLLAMATLGVAATTADAKPRKVVVVDFDGLPRQLADTGRSRVMALLGNEYDLVPTKKWETARGQAPGRGPAQWSQAAKSSGVDAVIEGWVNTEGRHHTLTVQVRNATTGVEIDSVSVNIGDKGLASESEKSLVSQLDDVLGWINPDVSDDVSVNLPPPDKQLSHRFNKPSHIDEDDQDDGYDRDDRDPPRSHRHYPTHDGGRDGDHYRSSRDSDDRYRDPRDNDHSLRMRERDDGERNDDRDHRDHHETRRTSRIDDDTDDRRHDDDRKRDDKDRAEAPTLKNVATADPADKKDTDTLLTFFPADSKENTAIQATSGGPRIMKPTPKFFLEGGAYISSRGMNFTQDPPDSQQGAPSYPAQGLAGISLQGSIYPYPINKLDYDSSGIGFSFGIQKSVGSMFSAYDPDGNTYGDYTINNTAYNGAIHYKIPTEMLTFDADISYGNFAYAIEGLPGGVQVPDVDYSYIGIGGTLDLKVTDRTRAGFGAHYMYMLDTGDVSDETWYGAGTASGLDLEAHFQIPINDMLYIRGMLDYRRVSMDFEQSGDVSYDLQVGNIVDSTIGASALLGVQF